MGHYISLTVASVEIREGRTFESLQATMDQNYKIMIAALELFTPVKIGSLQIVQSPM